MSTSTEYMDGLNAPAERRFYPRVTPPTPIYVAFGSNNLGVLHNVSENGFQVSTPSELALNSVFRVSLSLNGAPKTISVTVRTIWTDDGQKRSGIQLLDLSEDDRQQIRKWIEFEMSRNENPNAWFLPRNGERRSVDRNSARQNSVDGNSLGRNAMGRQPVDEVPFVADHNRVRAAMPPASGNETREQAIPEYPAAQSARTPSPVRNASAAGAASAAAMPPPFTRPVANAGATEANLPPIANPFDDPGPSSQFEQFPSVPLPIHGEFEYAAPPKKTSRSRRASSWRSQLHAKPLILWAVALALICFGANALVRYKISSASRRFASESAKYTAPKPDAVDAGSAPTGDSNSNPAAPADTQPSTNSASDDSSASSAPSTTNAQNDSSPAAAAPASRSAARNSEATQPDPRRESSLDADARTNRAYTATAPPASDRSEESARESQPAPAPRSWSAPAPNRSSSNASASDAPQSPNVVSSSNAPAQSNSPAIVSQVRPAPPVTPPAQTPATSNGSNSSSSSSSNSVVNNAPPRTQPPANSQQSSTYASNGNSNGNTTPPSRPQSPIYNANTPAQRSAIIGSINQVHSSGIFDSNDSTSATSSAPPAASRSANANVATRTAPSASVVSAPVTSTDVPQDRDLEIPAPKGFTASWVELPGEHVVRSAAGTVHIRRMVRVPGERIPGQRWLWRGKLDVTLGDVVNRVDPAAVQGSGASGSLTVMASIDKDGYVTDLKPINGNFALLPSVSRTVRNWHYQPTYLDNKRAETQAQIEFDLRPVPVSASNRAPRP